MTKNQDKPLVLRDGTIISPETQKNGYPIRTAESNASGDHQFIWYFENDQSDCFIVAAPSEYDAYDEVLDLLDPIPANELHLAYGCDTQEEFTHEGRDDWELADGYEWQPHGTGETGIVFAGYAQDFVKLTPRLLDAFKLDLRIKRW